tara:strand:- start:3968 stop:5389 length:1422 start_codon:yes stop_codon:yes gene_type:complete
MNQIKFGTDGWRGIMNDTDFTPENVGIFTQGTLNYLKDTIPKNNLLIVGYDTRFKSKEFALTISKIACSNGFKVLLSDSPCPTPFIGHNIITKKASAGIMVTASHNPSEWNGLKFKPGYGGTAKPSEQLLLEKYIQNIKSYKEVNKNNSNKNHMTFFSPYEDYYSNIKKIIDLDSIKSSKIQIAIDSMFGAGAGYIKKILSDKNLSIHEINSEENPKFPGIRAPEPVEENLVKLKQLVREKKINVGLATDGDGDRLGLIDDNGQFINSADVFSILCYYEIEIKKNSGPIVKSITMSHKINSICNFFNIKTFETPVGFKHLSEKMLEKKAVLAGEESGGFAFNGAIGERDGILSGLKILEFLSKTEYTIPKILKKLKNISGEFYYTREDIQLKNSTKTNQEIVKNLINDNISQLGGIDILQINSMDGYKFILKNDNWAAIRFSGTEPLIRLYCEARTNKLARKIISDMESKLNF